MMEGVPQWGRAQTYTLIAFFTAVVLWVLPGLAALLQGTQSPLYRTLGTVLNEGVAALLAGSLLFLFPVSWNPPRVTIVQMLRAGILLDIVGYILLLIMLRILCPLLGLA